MKCAIARNPQLSQFSYTNPGHFEIFAGFSRYSLIERKTLDAFDVIGRTPEFFRFYLDRYVVYASEGSPLLNDFFLDWLKRPT